MALKEVKVEVDELAYELAEAIVRVISLSKGAFDNGWQPAEDLPVLFNAIFQIVPLVGKFQGVPGAYEENKVAFIKALNLAGFDLADILLKKA